MAVVTLDRDLGAIAGTLTLSALDPARLGALSAAHARFVHAGYSFDRSQVLTAHEGCEIVGFRAAGALALHDCDATNGDSGSPILLDEAGSYSVAAMHVATTRTGSLGIALPGDAIIHWLEDIGRRKP